MSTFLRKALGLTSRHKLTLEEFTTAEVADPTVVMKGPLAANYTDALAQVYNKNIPDPSAAPEPNAETGANVDPTTVVPTASDEVEPIETIPEITQVILESQAMDAAVVQALQAAATNAEPDADQEYSTLYSIDESQIQPDNVVEVTKLLAEAEDPESVSVLIDDVLPTDPNVEVTEVEANQTKEIVLGLESIVTAMGGKVFRNFKDYAASNKVSSRKKRPD